MSDLKELKELSEKRESLKKQIQDLHAPSDDEIKNLFSLREAVNKARIQLDASALRICFNPKMRVEGTAKKDGQSEAFASNESLEWQAAQAFELDINGVGNLSISSGSGEVRNLKANLEKKERELGLALGRFGGAGINELADMNTQAKNLKKELDGISNQGKKSPEVLEGSLNTLKRKEKQILDESPELESYESLGEDIEETLIEAKQNLVKLSSNITKAEKDLKFSSGELDKLKRKQQSAKNEIVRIKTAIENQRTRENELSSDGLADAELQEKLIKALNELDQEKQRLGQIPPVENMQALEKEEKSCRDNVKKLQEKSVESGKQLNTKEGELQGVGGEGLYSKLAKAEENAALLESRHQSALTYANSVKLLRDTLDKCRQEAMDSIVAPVNQRVSQKFQQIAGNQYGEINFNNEFMPETIFIPSRDIKADPKFLSYGTQEQLNILVRIILGEILAENENQRQLVVLDDPLAHTDAIRHSGMLELLNDAANHLQLIILTCHPEAYQGINARGFDLEELKRSYADNR